MSEKIEFMKRLAKDAGKIAMKYYNQSKDTSIKEDNSIVTNADFEVNEFIIKNIKEKYPDHNIITEEEDEIRNDSEFSWYIDPIDGTENYSRNFPLFCVSIALAKNDEIINGAVYLPVLDEMYYATKGEGAYVNGKKIQVSTYDKLSDSTVTFGKGHIREHIDIKKYIDVFLDEFHRLKEYGTCAIELIYIASGKIDGMVRYYQKSWDYTAGSLIVTEAGGKVTGIKYDDSKFIISDVIVTNGKIHDEIIELIKNIETK